MTGLEIAIGVMLIILSVVIIAVILLQEGRQANLGAIQGASESFLDRGKARTLDAILSKWTKIIVFSFFILVFIGMLITKFFGA